VPIAPDQLPDDLEALKRIIAAMARDALAAQAEIAKLKFQLARYRRAEFGRSSEKQAREAQQLELAIEALEADRDCQEFRAEVGHDRSKGARRCRDAKNLAYLTPSSTSCWPAPIRRRLSTRTG
jgi:hypothetical protein